MSSTTMGRTLRSTPAAALLGGLLLAAPAGAVAQTPAEAPQTAQQQPAPMQLTLERAIELARQNNPNFLQQRNNLSAADWDVRAAYGRLLPSANASLGMQYQAKGNPQIGIFSASDLGLQQQAYYYSDYSLGLSYQIGGSTFFDLAQAKASRRSTEARATAAGSDLDSQVKVQYIGVLLAQDAVKLAQAELDDATENLKLARARVEVGDVIELEAKQAEVERGRKEVDLITAQSDLDNAKMRLMETLGAPFDQAFDLTTTFEVFDPAWTAQELIERAMSRNPTLRADRSTAKASDATVRAAASAYFPTLSMSVGWSGYTRQAGSTDALVRQAEQSAESSFESCGIFNQISDRLTSPLAGFPVDCSTLLLSDEQRSRIRSQNQVFPFDFTQQPMTLQARLSLPIFNGFSRERQLQQARADADDATYRVRATELKLRTDVTTALHTLQTAYRTVGLEQRNADLAAEQLGLARERYRLGLTSFVDLIDAETIKARADRAYLQARYTFHESFAQLESAVGEPLRTTGESR